MVAEVATLYAPKGLQGISLDFERVSNTSGVFAVVVVGVVVVVLLLFSFLKLADSDGALYTDGAVDQCPLEVS